MKKQKIRFWDIIKKQNMYCVSNNDVHIEEDWDTQYKTKKVIDWETALKFYKTKAWIYEKPLIHHYFKNKNQFYCQSCGLDFNEDKNRKYMTIDHIIALRTGYGWDRRFDPINNKDYSNLQMLCRKCNANKSAKFYSSKNTTQIENDLWIKQTNWISKNKDNLWDSYLNLTSKQRRKKDFDEWCVEQCLKNKK